MTFFNTTVPKEDTLPPEVGFKPIPSGKYRARLQGIETAANGKGWEAVQPGFQITDDKQTGRSASGSITTSLAEANDKAEAFSAQQLAALANALGIAPTDGNGSIDLAAANLNSTQDVVDFLNGGQGNEVIVSIRTGPRRRKNKTTGQYETHYKDGTTSVVNDRSKEAWIDTEVVGYEPVE